MVDASITLATLATIIAVVSGIYGIYSNKKKNNDMDAKDNMNEGRQTGTILSELGYIKSSVDDIKNKQDRTEERYLDVSMQLVKLQAFKEHSEDKFTELDHKLENIEKRMLEE